MTRTIPFVVSWLFLFGLYYEAPIALQSAKLAIIPTVGDSPSDTLFFSIEDCFDEASLCLVDMSLVDAIHFSVMVNGEPYQKTLAGCNFDTISAYSYNTLFGGGNLGPYELTEWKVDDTIFTGVFQNIPALVDSMNVWDTQGNWVLDTAAQSISGGVGSNQYSAMKVLVTSINTPSFIGYNFGMQAFGTELRFNSGIHNVNIFDSLRNTIKKGVIVVSCIGKTDLEKRVLIGETKIECLDFSKLTTAPKVVAFCGFLSQENVDFEIINNDSCIAFTGSHPGVDTACIIACDDFNFCDTTLLIVEAYDVPHSRTLTIDIPVGTEEIYCLDTTVLAFPINRFLNACPAKGGAAANILFNQTTFCTAIEGTNVGHDTFCLVLCNQIGRCDTTILQVNVYNKPITERIELSLIVGDSQQICVEIRELTGNVTEIDNICENNPTGTIIFDINNVDLCLDVTAQKVGKDSICAVICDNFLICDTTFYIISVVSSTLSLTATPDQDTSAESSPTTINILGNDFIPNGILTNLELYALNGEPTKGIAIANPDGTINYTPNPDFCGNSDVFGYIICNDAGCDSSQVTIYVPCAAAPPSTTMTIYNGFSPNGDGVNDVFRIDGIAAYPNNELTIFNRWGIKIYEMKGYKNAWDGTWNKKTIPDGVYFYVLKDGEGKEYSGAVTILK